MTRNPHHTRKPMAKRGSRELRMKPAATAVALALLSLSGGQQAFAAPTGVQVVGGAATIQQPNAQTTVINQSSTRAALNWNTFNIGAGESVTFNQPSSSSVALNRVVGTEASSIFGSLTANGHVFLVNPNGVTFARGATVDVGGLVASTLNISNQDFMAGRYVFSGGSGAGSVVNHATIRAANGGYVALLGKQVDNTGTIVANNGSVAFGAGEKILLDFGGDGLLNLKVDTAAAGARIDHGGVIQADGGQVIMTAAAKNALVSTVLNVDGIVRARGLVERNGKIHLDGGRSGVTSVSGTLDATSANAGQTGGEIRVLGEYVGLFGNALLDASGMAGGGTVLVGGDFQGRNPEIPNAFRTYVGPNALIKADASANGDGGKVIVWADDVTRFFGNISARGGDRGGNGGFVEVSGKNALLFRGKVDLSAPLGKTGTLLLDPVTINIEGGTGDGDDTGADPATFAGDASAVAGTVEFADATPTNIRESEIEDLNADIILRATRDITVSGTFTHQNGNIGNSVNGVLSLATGRSLTLQTRNAAGDGAGGIDLTGSTHGAALNVLTSGAGNITINAGTDGAAGATANLPQLTTISAATVTTGNITVTAAGAIAVNSALATGAATGLVAVSMASGSITLTSTSGGVSGAGTLTTGVATANGPGVGLTSTSGGITVTATGGNIQTGMMTTGAATIVGGGDVATSGSIALTGGSIGTNAGAPQLVTIGTASGATANTAGALTLSTTGAGAAGNIFVSSAAPLTVGDITTAAGSAQTVDIRTTGNNPLTFRAGATYTGVAGNGTPASGDTLNVVTTGGTSGSVTFGTNLEAGLIGVNASGAISLGANLATSAASSGGLTLTGALTLTSAAGGVSGAGTLTTGAATANADSASSGNVVVTATGGNIQTGTITSGAATVTGPTGSDVATSGSITLSGGSIGTNGATRQNVAIGTASGGDTNTTGTLALTSTGAGAAGNIFVGSASALTTGTVSATAAGSSIDIQTTGVSLRVGGAMSVAAGSAGSITLAATGTGDILGSQDTAGVITSTGTGGVTLSGRKVAQLAEPVRLDLGGTGTVSVTTTGIGNDGQIGLSEKAAAGLKTSQILAITTDASVQQISIEQTGAGGIIVDANIGNAADRMVLAGTKITGGAGTVTGGEVWLSGTNGVGTSTVRVNTAAGKLQATSNVGGVFVNETDAVELDGSPFGNLAGGAFDYDLLTGGTITVTNAVSPFLGGAVTGNTTLRASAGNIVLNAAVGNGVGNVVLTSNAGNITGTGLVSGPSVTLDSATGVGTAIGDRVNTTATTLAARSTTTGGVFVNETDGVTLSTVGSVTNGAVSTIAYDVTAAGAISVTAPITNTNGAVNLTATGASGSISESGGGLVSTTGTLTTSSVTGQTLNGANTVGTFNATNTTSGNVALTNTAAPLTITGISQTGGGSATVTNAGAIDITGTIAAAGGGAVNLTATGASGSITESGAGLINTTGTLTTSSVTGQTLNGANTVGTLSATNTTSGAVSYTDADSVSVSGTNTGGGAFNVTANGAGTITVNAGNINANTGAVTLQADEMVLTGTVTGNGGVTLRPNTAGTPITLGVGTAGLDFTNTALQQVFTTGVLTIGSDSAPAAGSITIDAPIAGGTNWTTLSLRTTGAVVDGNGAGLNITVGNPATQGSLAIRAATGIGSAADPLETSGGGNANGLNFAYINTGAGGVSIANTGRLRLAAVDGVTVSNSGTGATNISASSPVDITTDQLSAADIIFTAGEDPAVAAGDDLTVFTGVTVRSTGGDVTLRAGDQVTLTGTALVESTNAGGRVLLRSGHNDNDVNAAVGAINTINGTGRARADFVALDSLTGIGAAGSRFNTTAGTLAARTRISGDVFVTEFDGVTIDTVNVVLGGALAVTNGTNGSGQHNVFAPGAITINGPISTTPTTAGAAGGAVVLESNAAITSIAAGTITTSGAANGAGAGGNAGEIFIRHTAVGAADITLGGAITANGGSAAGGGTTGGNGGVVTIVNADGSIGTNAALSANGGAIGSAAEGNAGTVQLRTAQVASVASTITQTAAITATGVVPAGANSNGGLKITATDTVTLQNAGNDVAKVAANITTLGKAFGYTDANSLSIDTVAAAGTATAASTTTAAQPSLSGITTNGGAVAVSAGTLPAHTLVIAQPVLTTPTTGATQPTRAGGSVFLTSSGAITSSATGTITTMGQASPAGGADVAGVGGEVLLHSTGAGAITLGAGITASGGASVEGADTGGAGGVVTIRADNGNVIVHNITTDGGAPGGGAAGVGGTIQLRTGTTGNTIAQQPATALLARGGVPGTGDGHLKVSSTGSVTLANAGNDVGLNTIAALVTDLGAGFSYTDANSVRIGTVAAAGTGAGATPVIAGITTNGGPVAVRAITNTLSVDEPVTTTPTAANTAGGTVVLEAGGPIVLANNGTVTTTGTGSGAGGQVFLHAGTSITQGRAITATGGAGGGSGGVVTLLADGGGIGVNANIDVSGSAANDGAIQLQSAGDIVGGNVIGDTNGRLLARTTGAAGSARIDLTGSMNTAAFSTVTSGAGADGSVRYIDTTRLTIGTTGGEGTLTAPSGTLASSVGAFSGVTTRAGAPVAPALTPTGAVAIRAGTAAAHDLLVNEAVLTTPTAANTAGGTVVLEAGGPIVLANNGTVTTTGTGSGAGGQVFLHAGTSITQGRAITATGGAGGGSGGVVTLLADGGGIGVNANIDVSGSAANDGAIQLQSAGDIVGGNVIGDTNGRLLARTTGGVGSARIDLTGSMNTAAFSTVTSGAGADGSVRYIDTTRLTIGTTGGEGTLTAPSGTLASSVGAFSGVTTRAGAPVAPALTPTGAVAIRAGTAAAHDLLVNEAVLTTPTAANTAGGTVALEAGGPIVLASNGTVTTTGNGSGAGGEVFFHAGAGGVTLGRTVTATGGAAGNGGVVTVLADAGDVAVNANIDVSRGAGGANDGTIQLQATTGNVTGGAVIGDANGSLLARAGGNINLGGSVNTAALDAGGSIDYTDTTRLTIGTAGGAGTLTAPSGTQASSVAAFSGARTRAGGTAGHIAIRAGTTAAHDLAVTELVETTPGAANAAGGTVVLEAGGPIVTSGAGRINTANDVVGATGNGGEVFIHAGTSVTLGQTISATGGAGGNGAVVTVLADAGDIAVNANINVNRSAAGANDGAVQLQASGNITGGNLIGDTNGRLLARTTGAAGSARIDLTGSMNTAAFSTVTSGAGADGRVTYADDTRLTLGTAGGEGTLTAPSGALASSVTAFSGVTTRAGAPVAPAVTPTGAVTIRAGTLAAHDLLVDRPVLTTPTAANTAGDTVALQAGGPITTTAGTGTITTTGSASVAGGADAAGAGGEVLLRSTGGAITLNAAITASGGAAVEAADSAGAGGTVTVRADAGNIILNNVTTSAGTAGAAGAAGGLIQLRTGSAGNTITQTAGTALVARGSGTGADGSLKILATGNVTLNNAGNEVGTLGAQLSDLGADLSYTDTNTNANTLALDRITQDGTLTGATLGAAPTSGTQAIATNGGDVQVVANAGVGSAAFLTVNKGITTTPTTGAAAATRVGGTVRLVSGGIRTTAPDATIVTTGQASAAGGTDTAGAGGEVLLQAAGGNVVAGTIDNNVTLNAGITASGGAAAEAADTAGAGGTVTVRADAGNIVLNNVTTSAGTAGAAGAAGGLIQLRTGTAGNTITQTAGTALLARGSGAGADGGLKILATGNVTLNNAGNEVGTLGAQLSDLGADLSYTETNTNANTLALDRITTDGTLTGAVIGAAPTSATQSIVTNGGDVQVVANAGAGSAAFLTVNKGITTTPTTGASAATRAGGTVRLVSGGIRTTAPDATIVTTGQASAAGGTDTAGAGGEVLLHAQGGNVVAGTIDNNVTLNTAITAAGGAAAEAADTAGAGGTVTVRADAGNIVLNNVTTSAGTAGAAGAAGGLIQLRTGTAGNTITQTAGTALLARGSGAGADGGLKILATGNVTLNNAGNEVGTLGAQLSDLGADLSYTDTNTNTNANTLALDRITADGTLSGAVIGAVATSATQSIVTNGGDVQVVANAGAGSAAFLTVNKGITTTPATGASAATRAGGTVRLVSGGIRTTAPDATIVTTGQASAAGGTDTAGAGGEVLLHAQGGNVVAGTIDNNVTLNTAITASGGAAAEAADTAGAGGTVTVRADAGNIVLNNVTTSAGTAGAAGAAGGLIQLRTGTVGNTVTQTAGTALVARGSGAGADGRLKILATGAVTLLNAGNDVGTLATQLTDLGADFAYNDANTLALDRITTDGALTGAVIGPIPVTPPAANATQAIVTNGGDVLVTSGGALTVARGVLTTPTTGTSAATRVGGTVLLRAPGITSNAPDGTIVTSGQASAAGGADAAGAGGEVLFHSTAGPIALNAGVTASGGAATDAADTAGAGGIVTVRADNGNILLNNVTTSGGALVLGAPAANAAAGGQISLRTGGAGNTIGQTAGTSLLARGSNAGVGDGRLKILGTGTVVLDNPTNDVGTLAALLTEAGASLTFRDGTTIVLSRIATDGVLPNAQLGSIPPDPNPAVAGSLVPDAIRVPLRFTVIAPEVSIPHNVTAIQVEVRTDMITLPMTGLITATQPFSNTSDINAAVTLRGLTGRGVFGLSSGESSAALENRTVRIQAPNLFVVDPNKPNAVPFVFLSGRADQRPIYIGAGKPEFRPVFYNDQLPDSPEGRAALSAALDQLRRLLEEINLAGFAKENIRKELTQGLVLETGLARPGIDEFVGDGVAPPAGCLPNEALAKKGVLACQ